MMTSTFDNTVTSLISQRHKSITFVPEGSGHRHVDEHGGGESLLGALRDDIWHPLHCKVGHGLQPVHGHVEILGQGADVVHGRHLQDKMPQEKAG